MLGVVHQSVFRFSRLIVSRPELIKRGTSSRPDRLLTYAQEDPTITYDLHAAFSKDPETVRMEDAYDEYTKIQKAAIKAGKRPPRKKKRKFDAVGNIVGTRHINREVPRRVRERLVVEGMSMKPNFYIGRYGLNKVVVERIRRAFRNFEIVRLEVGSPWTDNTVKVAERLELRTGAIVLDRAGGRFLLYRGFTHADLARKGLLDPGCFTMETDSGIHKSDEEDEWQSWKKDIISKKKSGIEQTTKSVDNVFQSIEKAEDTLSEEEISSTKSDEKLKSSSTLIDLDDEPDLIIKENKKEQQEQELTRVMKDVSYYHKRTKGTKVPKPAWISQLEESLNRTGYSKK